MYRHLARTLCVGHHYRGRRLHYQRYYDVKIDLINKPERVVVGRGVSRRYAILLHGPDAYYRDLSWASPQLEDWSYQLLQRVHAAGCTLNLLKRLPFVGNFVVAFLTAGSIALPWLLYPFAGKTNILIYTLFAFFATLVREIIKDLEDLKGDNTFGCKTLPIIWGLRKTKNLIYALAIAFVVSVFLIQCPGGTTTDVVFFDLPVCAGGVANDPPRSRADTKKSAYKLSQLCKVMVLGIFSMALIER